MSTKLHARWVLIIGLILVIVGCAFGCTSVVNNYNKKYPSEKFPIRTLSIQIDQNQRGELFTQLRKFSERYNLEFHLSFYKNNTVFFIEMYGKGLEILALSKPVNITELDIRLFEEDPTNPPSQEVVEELFGDLKEFISEIPNVTITEER